MDRTSYVFKEYLQNCIYSHLSKCIPAEILSNNEYKIIVYLKGHNILFIKDLHYSYEYKKQYNLTVPSGLDSLYGQKNLNLFFKFLVNEYFNNFDTFVSNAELNNPLVKYSSYVCYKDFDTSFLPTQKIMIVPSVMT